MQEKICNILFTCAGRRNYLLDYFREALEGKCRLFAADMDPMSPALCEADISLTVPAVDDPHYIRVLLQLVRKHGIQAIVPLNDLELRHLSRNKGLFESLGARVVVSDPHVVEACEDKWHTYLFFRDNQIDTPLTFKDPTLAREALENGRLRFPVVVKPRWGSASFGIELAHSYAEFDLTCQLLLNQLKRSNLPNAWHFENLLIQEFIGGREFGMDVVNDLTGAFHVCHVREKLSMRSGETDKARSVSATPFRELATKISSRLGHHGNLDCDFIRRDERVYMIEMNARFGGGYPFSHAAGARVPQAYTNWIRGHKVFRAVASRPEVVTAKCDRMVQVANASGAGQAEAVPQNAFKIKTLPCFSG